MEVNDPRLMKFKELDKIGDGYLCDEVFISFTEMKYIILSEKFDISFPISEDINGQLYCTMYLSNKVEKSTLSGKVCLKYKKYKKRNHFIKNLK